jgi:protein-S-isoprenylcysteine O-methyltransferase Ste14
VTYDQIVLSVILAIFLVTLASILVVVRRQGNDTKGVIGEYKGDALVTSGASLLWVIVTLLYIFEARSVDWFGRITLLDHSGIKATGIALSIAGLLVCVAGEVGLGEAFCLALPKTRTALVTRGIYRFIRNPCVSGVFLLVVGTVFIAPSLLALLAMFANVIGYEMKVRAEEDYLRRMHGAEYEAYCARTGRYWPLIKRRVG